MTAIDDGRKKVFISVLAYWIFSTAGKIKEKAILELRPLHNSAIRHSGLDPESRKYLIILDSGFRGCVIITFLSFRASEARL
jgi:hypothetical protein